MGCMFLCDFNRYFTVLHFLGSKIKSPDRSCQCRGVYFLVTGNRNAGWQGFDNVVGVALSWKLTFIGWNCLFDQPGAVIMHHQTTGDPFIDAGGLAMEAVWEYGLNCLESSSE